MGGLSVPPQTDVNMVQFKFQKRFDMIDENDFDEQDYSSRPQGHLRLFMGAFPVVTYSAADWVTTPARKLDVGPVSMSMGSSERWQVRGVNTPLPFLRRYADSSTVHTHMSFHVSPSLIRSVYSGWNRTRGQAGLAESAH
jgi:hypothetical protein